jgi:hypothetical protein
MTAHGIVQVIDALTLHGLALALVRSKLSKPKD